VALVKHSYTIKEPPYHKGLKYAMLAQVAPHSHFLEPTDDTYTHSFLPLSYLLFAFLHTFTTDKYRDFQPIFDFFSFLLHVEFPRLMEVPYEDYFW
jgi:hypothetical protein